ncbi:MAG: DNA methyltransferase, partial [Gammaproteobacteria bacterium]|nr:DNA methyltransferase [Gammaproteobacteria bacterium]
MSPPAIRAYLKEIAAIQSGGEFTEHSFRGALQKLLQAHLPGVDITNEPGRIMEGGAPDYVLKRNQIPLGYIEAKNIDKSLDDKTFRDQFNRYLQSLDNLIFTNYLEFRFHRDAETKPVAVIAIAELRNGKIKPLPENFARFENLIADFGAYQGQTITTAADLARRMADKA